MKSDHVTIFTRELQKDLVSSLSTEIKSKYKSMVYK